MSKAINVTYLIEYPRCPPKPNGFSLPGILLVRCCRDVVEKIEGRLNTRREESNQI